MTRAQMVERWLVVLCVLGAMVWIGYLFGAFDWTAGMTFPDYR